MLQLNFVVAANISFVQKGLFNIQMQILKTFAKKHLLFAKHLLIKLKHANTSETSLFGRKNRRS